MGDTLVEIESKDSTESSVDGAALKTIRAPLGPGLIERTMAPQLGQAPESDEMARWFEALIGVQRAAASSPNYFAETARAVVELIGLDCGLVLLRRDDDWDPVACYPPHDDAKSQFSRSILKTVVSQRRTFYQGDQFQASAMSLLGVTAVVASPILDDSQEVIGAVYGARRGSGRSLEIRPIEAQLTQVMAAAVAAGLARAGERGAGGTPARSVRAVLYARPGRRPRPRPGASGRPRPRGDRPLCRHTRFFGDLGENLASARVRADPGRDAAPDGANHGDVRCRGGLHR